MKIAIMSDSHDHIWNFKKALKIIEKRNIKHIIHLGDLISPFMLEELEPFDITFHLIFGNNNGDQFLLFRRISNMKDKVVFHGWLGELELSGKKIGFIHDPFLARKIARSGDYDVFFYGHTHLWHIEKLKGCLLINPGEIMGKKEPAGFAIFDCELLKAERIILDKKT